MLVLGLGAAARLTGTPADTAALWAYELVVGVSAVILFVDLRWSRRDRAAITGLVVDLGEAERTGVLADKLGRALGDPSLVLGYWLPETSSYVDEAGRPVDLPRGDPQRVLTELVADGQQIGVLVHDAAVLDDPRLVESVVALARMAVTNVRLQAEVQARVGDVEAARRRIIEAADAERRRLESLLQKGAMRRLSQVDELLTTDDRTSCGRTSTRRRYSSASLPAASILGFSPSRVCRRHWPSWPTLARLRWSSRSWLLGYPRPSRRLPTSCVLKLLPTSVSTRRPATHGSR